jgi:Carboxypeptidase regulatory-like domain/TonB dependent receptor
VKNGRTSSYSKLWVSLGALSLWLSVPKPMVSQAVYGSIRGSVTDTAGKSISGANITVISEEKGSQETAISNRSGFFTITHLVSDTYDVKVEAAGYSAEESLEQEVNADQVKDLAFQLHKGNATAPVQNIEPGSLLKTDRADVSTTLSLEELQDLPNFTRNFTAFESLAPGALPNPVPVSVLRPNQNPQQGQQINQNGQHFSGSAFQLDGTDDRDPIAGIIVINPPLESLSEMKITTQNFDAEFGQALSGLVTAQTRSGSNAWHGSAFEIRDSGWAEASAPNLPNPNVANNPFKVNEFGGSIGGPIRKNKLFFFGDYQGHRRAFDVTTFSAVPTQKVFNTCLTPGSTVCDLSDYLVTTSGGQSFGQVYQPKNSPSCGSAPGPGNPFVGNLIPVCMLSPQAINLLNYLPQPNTKTGKSGSSSLVAQAGYENTGVEPWNDDEFDLRADQNISEKLKLFGRYSFADFRIDASGVFGALAGGPGISTDLFAGTSRSRNQSISSGFDYILTPSLNVDFRFGFFRYHVDVFQNGLSTTPASDAGIPNLNLGNAFTSGMPAITINDGSVTGGVVAFGYGQTQICDCPLLEHEQQFQWASNWLKIRGNHAFKWGADIRYAQNLRVPSENHRAGVLDFESANTSGPPSNSGLALATFLFGNVSSFSRDYGNNFNAGERQKRWFFYGQDTWRASARLTLNYGLRWEIYEPESVSGPNNGGFLDLTTGIMHVAGVGDTNLQGNISTNFHNLAPRFGLAYLLNPHTVIRAAYGRSFDLGYAGAVFGDTVTQNPPVLETQQLQPSIPSATVFPGGLAAGPPPPPPLVYSAPGQFMLPNDVVANVVPSHQRLPTIDAWNFTVQHELNSTMFLELGYVANKGTHVFPPPSSTGAQIAAYDINQATLHGYLTPCTSFSNGMCSSPCSSVFDACPTSTASRQPFYSRQRFLAFGWTQQIFDFGNNASSSYESLQAKLEKRFRQGLQFRASYTWSKSTDFGQGYFAVNPRFNYGPSDFDRRNAFVLSSLWELPIGRGKLFLGDANGVLNRVVGGWALNTITSWYSGLPFTPTYKECAQDVIDPNRPCRPNLVGPVHTTGNRTNYYTTSKPLSPGTATLNSDGTFTVAPGTAVGPWQRPAPGTFGDAGRNSLRGPSFFNTNLALLKNVGLTEGTSLQFRVDVMNLFNNVNLGFPAQCVDCGPAGITQLADGATMRQFEFALRLQF